MSVMLSTASWQPAQKSRPKRSTRSTAPSASAPRPPHLSPPASSNAPPLPPATLLLCLASRGGALREQRQGSGWRQRGQWQRQGQWH